MAASNSAILIVGLTITLVAVVSAKPGYLAPQQLDQHQLQDARAHLRQRLHDELEEERLDRGSRSNDDYEDFPEVPPLLRLSFNIPEEEYFKTPGKRYLGIDIPDYISTGGKADAIKSMSNKMKAMGKK